jgi:hypothetical protein
MEGQTIIGLYPPTDETNVIAFKAWRDKNKR